ncbi:MAG: hypothetical protein QXG00_03560 [Candidatus Woesearchaeota archaeon]
MKNKKTVNKMEEYKGDHNNNSYHNNGHYINRIFYTHFFYVFSLFLCIILIGTTIMIVRASSYNGYEHNGYEIDDGVYGEVIVNRYFSENNNVSLNYFVANLGNETKKMNISVIVTCPTEPYPMPSITSVTIPSLNVFWGSLNNFMLIREDSVQQTCNIVIIDYDNKRTLGSNVFSINVMPSLQANILTCRDANCFDTSEVFSIGEDIYIDVKPRIYNVHNQGVIVSALTPKGKPAKIGIFNPKSSIKTNTKTTQQTPSRIYLTKNTTLIPEETGVYTITAIINISGYKPLSIEKKVLIKNNKNK